MAIAQSSRYLNWIMLSPIELSSWPIVETGNLWPRRRDRFGSLCQTRNVTAPALLARGLQIELTPVTTVVVFGAAVVASAFLLVWAAEAAGHDISGSLATAILAVIAVLPEYAVDLFFAYSAGHDLRSAQFAAANMTGSNRLLLGVGWPLVAILFAWGCEEAAGARTSFAWSLPGAPSWHFWESLAFIRWSW